MLVVDITAHEGDEIQRSGNAALLTVRTVFQMVGHLDGVLRHDQRIDFFSLPQFFFEQFFVFVGVGDGFTEAVIQLIVGNRPSSVVCSVPSRTA